MGWVVEARPPRPSPLYRQSFTLDTTLLEAAVQCLTSAASEHDVRLLLRDDRHRRSAGAMGGDQMGNRLRNVLSHLRSGAA
jgi:hypothetical protein